MAESHIMKIPQSKKEPEGNTEGILVNEPATNSPDSDTNPPYKPYTVWSFLGGVFKVGWKKTGEYVHVTLDVMAAIPVVGSAFDAINGAIYAAEGDKVNAAIAFSSAALDLLPGAGTVAKGAKFGYKAVSSATKGIAKSAEKIALKQAEKTTIKTVEKDVGKKLGKDTAKSAEKKTLNKSEKKVGETKTKTQKKEDGIQVKEKKGNKKSNNKTCPKAGHPVNPILGIKFLDDQNEEDFVLPAVLPISWQRSYFSDQIGNGWFGQGWSLPFSSRLIRRDNTLIFINSQGCEITFPRLDIGQRRFNRTEQLYFERGENGRHYVSTQDGQLRYTFAPLALDGRDRRGERAAYFPLIAITDGNNNCIRLIYNQYGLPIEIYDAAGRRLNLRFSKISLPDGKPVLRLHNVVQVDNVAGKQQKTTLVTYHYSSQGDLITVLDRNGKVTREYQYNNHILTQHSLPGGLIARYEYDKYTPQGKVIRHTTNLGQTWLFDYKERETRVTDPLQRVTRYQFDADKQFTAVVFADGSKTTRKLDDKGRLIALICQSGRETHWSYDHLGRVEALTDAAGHRTVLRYDMRHRVTSVTDAMGHTTRYDYNDSGNLLSETNALGQRTTYDYDTSGLLKTVTGTDGKTRRIQYDWMGLPITHTDCSGHTTRMARDSRGNIKAITYPDDTQMLFDYDERGKIRSVFQAEGLSIQNSYDHLGRLTTQTDALGAQTHWQRDIDGLPLVRTDAYGQRFHYHYDAARRLVGLTNENGVDYLITYDDMDNIVSEQGFDGVLTQYRYDKDGHLVNKQVADISVAMCRDTLGRVTEKHVKQADTIVRSHFSYDPTGQLIQASNADSIIKFTYDPLGRVESETSEVLGYEQTLRHHYHPGGWREQSQLPDGTMVKYLCYGAGDLYQLNVDNEVVCEIERNNRSREISRSQGKITSYFDYDASGKLLELRMDADRTSIAHVISKRYRYDRVGNLTSVIATSGDHRYFSYDQLGRLTKANNESFAFDPAHNLIETDGNQSLDNRLLRYQKYSYLYDNYGRLREKNTNDGERLRLYWTPDNRLSHIESEGDGTKNIVKYGYDALGRRVYKQQADDTTLFFWDGDRLLNEQNAGKTITYLYGASQFIPLAQMVQTAGAKRQINYYHTDPIGTPYAMTSHDGRVVWQGDYQPWGKRRKISSSDNEITHQPLCFQGQYYDKESGLHYNYHRYYDPDIGRFISPDPIGLAGGENVYQYAPNPTGWVDPLGLVKEHTGFVYRALNIKQWQEARRGDPILSKNPNANVSHKYHVGGPVTEGAGHAGGKNIQTQYLSASKSLEVAKCYARRDPEKIVKIDLSKIADKKIMDISNGHGLKGRPWMWAKRDKEVLIIGQIPPGAYELIRPIRDF